MLQVIRHEQELRKRQQLTPEAAAAHMQAASLSDQPAKPKADFSDISPIDTAAHEQRLKVLQSSAGTILTSVFSLMQDRYRLSCLQQKSSIFSDLCRCALAFRQAADD